MTQKIDPNPRMLAEIHEMASAFYRGGTIDEREMREFDELCLPPKPTEPEYSSEQIRALRERWELSQAELAGKLKVSPATIRRWEVGKTRPQGPVLVLLDLMDRKGVEVLAR
jgi:putative transcriptional regulator